MKISQVVCLTCVTFAGLFANANVGTNDKSPKLRRALHSILNKRQGFKDGQPIDGKGKGAPFSGWN